MHLNSYSIVAAVTVGLLTAGTYVALHRLADRLSRRIGLIPTLSVTLAVSGFANGVASLFALVVYGLSSFTVIHVTYLWVTLGIPLAACLIYIFDKVRSRLLLIITLVCTSLVPIGLYSTHIEPFWLRTDVQELSVATINEAFTIGVLSDLQTTSIGDYELESIRKLLSHDPDIVLLPGDLYQLPADQFDERVGEFQHAIELITDNVPLVILVSGNTDTVSGLRKITGGTPAIVLDDESLITEVNGNMVNIVGITLFGNQHSAQGALESLNQEEVDMTVLLAHQPDEIRRIRETPVDLLVAGHTHGGQVAIPFIGPLVTASSVPRNVAAGGLHTLHETPVYVSTGVGRERGTAPQLRFGVRPSIGLDQGCSRSLSFGKRRLE